MYQKGEVGHIRLMYREVEVIQVCLNVSNRISNTEKQSVFMINIEDTLDFY